MKWPGRVGGRSKRSCLALVVGVGIALAAGWAIESWGADEGAAAPDVWPEHSMTDDEAGRQGRSVLPFTQEQIEALGALLRQTQSATRRGAGPAPEGRVRRLRLSAPGVEGIPEIAVRRGYTTVVSFTDATGAPWPIEEALVEQWFLPAGGGEPGAEAAGSEHLLYLAPRQPYLEGNVVVKLRGLTEPVVALLRDGGVVADFRVDIRLGMPGPNADPAALVRPAAFHAGDPVLLGLLGGVVPDDVEPVKVGGGGFDTRAWRDGVDLLLVTRAVLLSPGPWAAERGAGGRWAYRLPETPYAIVSEDGREGRLSFEVGRFGEVDSWFDDEGG